MAYQEYIGRYWCPGASSPVLLVVCFLLASPASQSRMVDEDTWEVEPGDPVKSISRIFYPDDPEKAFRLQRELIVDNPQVFIDVDAPSSLNPGDRLTMPAFAGGRARELFEAGPEAETVPETGAPEAAAEHAESTLPLCLQR